MSTTMRFTVAEYDRMIEQGVFNERPELRMELIHGEIIEKMSIGERHLACVNRLTRLMARGVGDRAIVSIQNPVRFSDSEPEPDLSLLKPRDDFYESAKPTPADVFLLIEVADTTLDYDREVKRSLYAKARIPEYWIVNLVDDCLEVYRQPQPDGTYKDVKQLRAGDQVSVAALSGVTVAVADLL